MTNDSIELHTKASSSMIVKVEEVFFPSSSSMAMAMWFEENLNDVCSSLLANDDHTTLHSPVYNQVFDNNVWTLRKSDLILNCK